MPLKYARNGSDVGCSVDPWGGGGETCPSIQGFTFPGRGWYAGSWGGAAESQSFTWTPICATVVWGGAAESMTPMNQTIDAPLNDPGYPFNNTVNFATMLPSWDVGANFQIGANPITQYLTEHFAAKIEAALNNEWRGPVLSAIAAGDVPDAMYTSFSCGTNKPNIAWNPVVTDYSGSIFARTVGIGGGNRFMISYSKLSQIMTNIGANNDPIAATFMQWFQKAEFAAKQLYDKLQAADTKAFYTKAIVATMLVFTAAAGIAAISAAASSSAGIGASEVVKAAQLGYKAYSGAQTLSADTPDALGLIHPQQPSANSLAAMQAYVDNVTLSGLLKDAFNSAKDSIPLSQAGDTESAAAKIAEANQTYSEAQDYSSHSGLAIPQSAATGLANAFNAANAALTKAQNPPPPVPVATVAATPITEAPSQGVASILDSVTSGTLSPADADALAAEQETAQTPVVEAGMTPWIAAILIGSMAISSVGKKKSTRKKRR